MGIINVMRRRMAEAMALHTDFQLWYLTLEEHHKRGIEGIARDMVLDMRPRWIPKWLWGRWIKG